MSKQPDSWHTRFVPLKCAPHNISSSFPLSPPPHCSAVVSFHGRPDNACHERDPRTRHATFAHETSTHETTLTHQLDPLDM